MKNPAYVPAEHQRRSSRNIRGFSLVTSLIILLLLTILMVGMVRSAISQDTMTGNSREKARALRAAQTAMSYAEWWIKQNNGLPASCATGPRKPDPGRRFHPPTHPKSRRHSP